MRALLKAILLLLIAFSLLPVANWLPGGHGMPGYATIASEWMMGTLIVLGGAIVAVILSARIPALWRAGLWGRWAAAFGARPRVATAAIAALACAIYATVALVVFDGRPLLIDEIVSVFHGRALAAGRLAWPASPYPEFFSAMHLVETNGQVFSQYPVGGPALIALGDLAGAAWLVGPLCGGVAVAAFIAYLRRTETRQEEIWAAALLFALSPFVAFMSGTYMNHVPVMTAIVIAFAALARIVHSPTPLPWSAFGMGLALGGAASIRPLDGMIFALPAGAWILWRFVRDRSRWPDLVAAGIGVALPVALMLWVNAETTGGALRFGYNVLWGNMHNPGFHEPPYGPMHTPARGLELLNLYLLRLHVHMYDTPVPSLIPALAALLLTRRLKPMDRYLLVSSALLLGVYFTYWHDGMYLGPRFVFVLSPVIALWTARFLPLLRERLGDGRVYRTAVYGSLIAGVVAVCALVPIRATQYGATYTTLRWNADSAARSVGARNALIFVRESWGAQLLARLWALDMTLSEAERFYRYVDSCVLEQALTQVEGTTLRGPQAVAAMRPLLADSARVQKTPYSPDHTERYVVGTVYGAKCRQRIMQDREGFTFATPLLLARGAGNIYARDLHEHNAVLLAEYPDRPVYLLRPPTSRETELPRFYPLSRDSLLKAWGATQP